MTPGQHTTLVGLGARHAACLRDTVLILLPGPTVMFTRLFREPLDGIVAQNVLKHGVGGLNIDACRVGPNPGYSYNADKNGTTFHGQQGSRLAQSAQKRGAEKIESTQGRWPPNILLVHGPRCVQMGGKRVKGSHDAKGTRGQAGPEIVYGKWSPREEVRLGHTSPDGTETIQAWDCQPDCPIRMLDEQSGERRSVCGGGHQTGVRGGSAIGFNRLPTRDRASVVYSDQGAASRFYPQFDCLDAALEWLDKLTGTTP